MNKKIFLDKVLDYLVDGKNIDIPDKLEDKIKLWEELVSKLDVSEIPEDILLNEDKFLRLDLINRKYLKVISSNEEDTIIRQTEKDTSNLKSYENILLLQSSLILLN